MRKVLELYPRPFAEGVLIPWPGGFSGARLWKLRTSFGDFCLKASTADPRRIHWIHEQIERVQTMPFVPRWIANLQGRTWTYHENLCWELQSWMPGQADFHASPSDAKLRQACLALAQLHCAWGPPVQLGPCPAVLRRIEKLRAWQGRPFDPRIPTQFAHLLPERIAYALQELQPWTTRPMPLQPCLCDGWHDHFLFENDRLSGVIDFGSVKIDHRAVDLARLFGSMVPDHPLREPQRGGELPSLPARIPTSLEARRHVQEAWSLGLEAYQSREPLAPEDLALVSLLEWTGLTVAVLHWLDWLFVQLRPFPDPARAQAHADRLFARFLKA